MRDHGPELTVIDQLATDFLKVVQDIIEGEMLIPLGSENFVNSHVCI